MFKSLKQLRQVYNVVFAISQAQSMISSASILRSPLIPIRTYGTVSMPNSKASYLTIEALRRITSMGHIEIRSATKHRFASLCHRCPIRTKVEITQKVVAKHTSSSTRREFEAKSKPYDFRLMYINLYIRKLLNKDTGSLLFPRS